MRDFSDPLAAHLECTATTICTCWIVRRDDGVVLGFTDHDRPLEISGVTCAATSGFQPTEAVSEFGLSTDNQEVEGALSSEAITERDLLAGLYDNARIEVWMVNWADVRQSHLMRVAVLGEVTREDHLFRAQLRGQTSLLDQNTGRTFSRSCDATLGDRHCGVDLSNSAFTTEGNVLAVADRLTLTCSGLDDFEPGWFAHGRLTWLSGDNAELAVEISASQSDRPDQLKLWKAMPFAPAIGDRFRVAAGCDKSFQTCAQKFNNRLMFRGFPHMPGADFTLGYASRDQLHDGSALVR